MKSSIITIPEDKQDLLFGLRTRTVQHILKIRKYIRNYTLELTLINDIRFVSENIARLHALHALTEVKAFTLYKLIDRYTQKYIEYFSKKI